MILLPASKVALAAAAIAAAAVAAQGKPQETVTRGGVTASLFYTHKAGDFGSDAFRYFRIQIRRGGSLLVDQAVPPFPRTSYAPQPAFFFSHRRSVLIDDLDGDGEREVILDLYLGGAHCCTWSRVYRFDRARKDYVVTTHTWADAAFTLRDLDRDGRPEWVSADDRFAYRFTDYADSVDPIQIWSYRQGVFTDVTRRYPANVAKDAARWWQTYLSARKQQDRSVRGILAAWAADEEELGHGSKVGAGLEAAKARGDLDHGTANPGQSSSAYIRALLRFLRSAGYIR